jgi:hypothetical protein
MAAVNESGWSEATLRSGDRRPGGDWPVSVGGVDVGVAETGGLHLHQHLAVTGLR